MHLIVVHGVPGALAEYQSWKRTAKAAQKDSGKAFEPWADKEQAAKYAAGKPKGG